MRYAVYAVYAVCAVVGAFEPSGYGGVFPNVAKGCKLVVWERAKTLL